MEVRITDGYVLLGEYPQTGTVKEPIKWRVLCNGGGVLTLITDVILFNRDFDNRYSDYRTSDVRKYITEEFFQFAFSSEEQELILPTELEDGVCDRVYLPSLDELKAIERDSRIRKVTPYAVSTKASAYPYQGKKYRHLEGNGWYWTRTPHKPPYDPKRDNHVWYVSYSGGLETRPGWGADIGAVLMMRGRI
ncbi:MAG: hypothetical protein IJF05_03545 [Clostridia bacterium]|nr:hypothetical protein [Clostridia bacterium]